ncbi:MAG: Crp/Fnr family transcriptional regulator [Firmicutes bacterium]|nr:Crp/Fnr family transcriptional regulator [Bacillota bacterium]
MEEYLPVLQHCPLFAGIDPANVAAMLNCLGARLCRFDKGQVVLAEGEPARYLGIVLSGGVQLTRVDFYGNRSIVGQIGPGRIFGESFACAGVEALPVDVTATAAGAALLIDARRVTRTCSSACEFHSRVIFNLLQIVATKNLMFDQKLAVTAQRTTRDKLMAYLLLQAKQAGSDSFTIPYDRQELADYLEVERSGLSAEIGRLRREGVIESSRNHFRLL